MRKVRVQKTLDKVQVYIIDFEYEELEVLKQFSNSGNLQSFWNIFETGLKLRLNKDTAKAAEKVVREFQQGTLIVNQSETGLSKEEIMAQATVALGNKDFALASKLLAKLAKVEVTPKEKTVADQASKEAKEVPKAKEKAKEVPPAKLSEKSIRTRDALEKWNK